MPTFEYYLGELFLAYHQRLFQEILPVGKEQGKLLKQNRQDEVLCITMRPSRTTSFGWQVERKIKADLSRLIRCYIQAAENPTHQQRVAILKSEKRLIIFLPMLTMGSFLHSIQLYVESIQVQFLFVCMDEICLKTTCLNLQLT